MSRSSPFVVVAGVLVTSLSLASCGGGGDAGDLSATQVRHCLARGEQPLAKKGLLFSVHKKEKSEAFDENDDFIGMSVGDVTASQTRSVTVSVLVSDEDEFLDRWERQELKTKSKASVDRVENAVVSYNGKFNGNLAVAKRWVESCLEPGKA